MVDHLTRVTVELAVASARDIACALAGRGFSVREERRRMVAESASVGAQDVKRYLRSLGFEDREYRVVLEYVRKWGVM